MQGVAMQRPNEPGYNREDMYLIDDWRQTCITFGVHPEFMDEAEKIASDFTCYVCGAVFTTEQDRRQHLEKELAGKARDETTKHDVETAKAQTELSETHRQPYESV